VSARTRRRRDRTAAGLEGPCAEAPRSEGPLGRVATPPTPDRPASPGAAFASGTTLYVGGASYLGLEGRPRRPLDPAV
jgi:hypothetical protein